MVITPSELKSHDDAAFQALRERSFALHERGDLGAAESAYSAVLERAPYDFEVKHALAVLAVQTGRYAFAAELIAVVIEASQSAAAHTCLGNALQGLSRLDDALRSYDCAIALESDYAPAHINRGHVLRSLGRLAEALACYDRTIASWPQFPQALLSRAEVLLELQRWESALPSVEELLRLGVDSAAVHTMRGLCQRGLNLLEQAIATFDRAILRQPDYAPAHVNRGVVLRELKRPEEALASYEAALAICPDSYEAITNRATALLDLKRLDEALVTCDRAIALWPNRAEDFYLRRAAALVGLERMAEALTCYDTVIASRPAVAEAYAGRAHVLQESGRSMEALSACDMALTLAPRMAYAHFIRGVVLRGLKRFEEALASFTAASLIEPEDAVTNFAIACLCLLMGKFERGWSLYPWGAKAHGALDARRYTKPLWNGSADLRRKTLFVYPDQGLGDTILFVRYVKLAEARGARVVVSVQNALRRLMSGLGPGMEILGESEAPPPDFDFHCPLARLPGAFGTTVQSVPAAVPYLYAEPERVGYWRNKLGAHGFRIGVCWQGSRLKTGLGRSFPLSALCRVSSLKGVSLLSLQKLDGATR
jgi:tetratricopeptide (TPR) repeat protein